MPHLNINGRNFTWEQIREGKAQPNSTFEADAFQFCYEWLNGATHFELITSGSTGTPKIVAASRSQMEASAKLTLDTLALSPGMMALLCLNAGFIAGKMMLVRCMVGGLNIIAIEPSGNPADQLPARAKIDFAALVPLQLQNMLQSKSADVLHKLGKVIVGGAPLAPMWIDRLQSYNSTFFATYGMTETLSHIALQQLNGDQRQDSFRPLGQVHVSLDERDCLVVYAPHLSSKPFVTNDMAEILVDNSFRILGRWDNVINSGAVKIIPEQIEPTIGHALETFQFRGNFFVGAKPDKMLGQRAVLLLESSAWPITKQEDFLNALRNWLPPYQAPKQVLFVPAFIYSPSGKVLRRDTLNLLPAEG